jgi:hypothetical protein
VRRTGAGRRAPRWLNPAFALRSQHQVVDDEGAWLPGLGHGLQVRIDAYHVIGQKTAGHLRPRATGRNNTISRLVRFHADCTAQG